MHNLNNNLPTSNPIVFALDYIYQHIHHRITVKEIAQYLNLSESYLSKLFYKEIDVPISQYIMNRKIEAGKKHFYLFPAFYFRKKNEL